ncbi:hypothetical protein P691DRAFT_805101 [Macrolepiota fuliginosa MF-IS2]|uniref:Nephrocystin 3-like N-terminal domain-containing protein n=1 Tax=Macrolepiota fuliginosa MF-IS2 TaxID=1400762 RepID=A0A9P5XIT2_9AGAR|nr:hypothetical protein P691DRAFT_805101 [Macrolepiota fuliginosa MF-IS2]
MPLPESSGAPVARIPKRKEKEWAQERSPRSPPAPKRRKHGEDLSPTSTPSRPVFVENPVQRPPAPAPPSHVQSTVDNGQAADSRNISMPAQQPPPVGVYSAATSHDQATYPSSAVPPPVPIVSTTSSVLEGAHHFTIGQLTAISQHIHGGTTVLQQLRERGKLAAMHDSSARAYPPKCHPNTRKSLRTRIGQWGVGDGSDERMFWVLGAAAVGKSAVAQTIAEDFEERDRLGASFFFSRPNQVDDPDWVIPTLAYQLAMNHDQYKRIITERLADDPSILDKNRRTQLKKLIIEPFHILMTEHPDTVREPLLIILDGLDECRDKHAQCEFIDLISTHVRQVDEFPLRWLICSRPEWHLQTRLANTHFRVVCERQELNIDDDEAQQDTQRLLDAGFENILEEYEDRLPTNWPPEDDVLQIAAVASGHLGFASFILRFIGDDQCSDPDSQLGICMKFLGRGGTVGAVNPLHALDLLYRQILSGVPVDILPITMQILGLFLFYSRPRFTFDHARLSAHAGAEFLGINQATFCRSLQNLHSVVYVPPVEIFNTAPLRVYHASFSDFLSDPNRSGKFYLDGQAVEYDVALRSLDWLENADKILSNKTLINFLESFGWDACYSVSGHFIPGLINRLGRFDFRCLWERNLNKWGFGKFLQWLHVLGSTRNKSLIAVTEEISEERASMSKWVQLEPRAGPARDYIASFMPGIDAPQLPFILNLRLGGVAQVDIMLVVIDREAREIINRLRKGFGEIGQKFRDSIPANWPPESHLLRIAAVTSGGAKIISDILKFIGNDQYSNPDDRLKAFINHLNNVLNPLYVLDILYLYSLSSMPADLLPTTLRILGFLIIDHLFYLSADDVAKFLNIDRVTFRRSLQNLDFAISVSPVEESGAGPLWITDVSFSEFLTDRNRSSKFYLDREAVKYDFTLQCLHWIENDDGSPSIKAFVEYSVWDVWYRCHELSDDIIDRLENFNFSCMTSAHTGGPYIFGYFLEWLHSLGSIRNRSLISVIQENPQEQPFISKWIKMVYRLCDPRKYIATFIPDIGAPKLPFTLNLRLGKVGYAYISLEVLEWRFP